MRNNTVGQYKAALSPKQYVLHPAMDSSSGGKRKNPDSAYYTPQKKRQKMYFNIASVYTVIVEFFTGAECANMSAVNKEYSWLFRENGEISRHPLVSPGTGKYCFPTTMSCFPTTSPHLLTRLLLVSCSSCVL